MAQKKQADIIAKDASIVLAGGLVQLHPSDLAALASTEINARGVVLLNERRNVRVPNMTDVDGHAAEFTCSIYVHRTPESADEADAMVKAGADRDARKLARTAEEQERRENELRRAVEITESALTKGFATASAQKPNIAEQVKDSLALAATLSSVLAGASKGLPAGN